MPDKQIKTLAADMFALKQLLPCLLSRVAQLDPILAAAIERGFQDTIGQVEHLLAATRSTETEDRCTRALASIRRLRAAVLTELSSPPAQAVRRAGVSPVIEGTILPIFAHASWFSARESVLFCCLKCSAVA